MDPLRCRFVKRIPVFEDEYVRILFLYSVDTLIYLGGKFWGRVGLGLV